MNKDNSDIQQRTDSRSSVEISRNSKGNVTFKVKGYNGDLGDFDDVKKKSVEIFEELREQYRDGN